MIADTETTTSTFEIKSLVATIHSRDFPLLFDGKDNGMFFRKQWGCTIFRGDAKTPLTLLPEEIGLAEKISPTAVCLSMSRDTMDACGICLGDLDINDDADIKLTISLMSHRSMQQFLQEVSSMKEATVWTWLQRECNPFFQADQQIPPLRMQCAGRREGSQMPKDTSLSPTWERSSITWSSICKKRCEKKIDPQACVSQRPELYTKNNKHCEESCCTSGPKSLQNQN